MIGSARQLIAEPAFVRHARDGEEHLDRTCIACNWCTAAGGDGAQGCTINPASYREKLWGEASFIPAPAPTRVVVIGGGPGGMEAARVAALRGHRVVLFEARDRLGGALVPWAALPGRGHYQAAIDWWSGEMDRLGIDVRLGVEATAETVLAESPGAVIVATGARYSRGGRSITRDADLPGSDLPHVLRPEDVLLAGARPKGKVIVLNAEGYHTGSGIAEVLAKAGADVSFVYATHAPISQRNTDNWEERYLVGRMKTAGVSLVPTTWARAIRPGEIVLYDMHTGAERVEPADAVVLATGREPLDGLARALEGKVAQLFTIGDALAARMFAAATFEGQMFARLIGEPDAATSVTDVWFAPDPPGTMPMPADFGTVRTSSAGA